MAHCSKLNVNTGSKSVAVTIQGAGAGIRVISPYKELSLAPPVPVTRGGLKNNLSSNKSPK